MKALKRQREILERAPKPGKVDVGILAADPGLAPETVRRDLGLLAGRGVMQPVQGAETISIDEATTPQLVAGYR